MTTLDTSLPQEGQKAVALVGFAESWKDAPWDHPAIEIWSLNEFWKYAKRWDRWFELHDADTLGISKRDLSEGEQKRHLEWLSKQTPGKPIYMQRQFVGNGVCPGAQELPLETLIARFGRYFTSTIGYMLGLAILEDYQWIGMYGIDLASDVEYVYQRPNAEYLIGLARGMGRTVYTCPSSAILKAGHLYGYEKALSEVGGIAETMKKHKATLAEKHQQTLAMLNTLDGAMQEVDNVFKLLDFKERGATPITP